VVGDEVRRPRGVIMCTRSGVCVLGLFSRLVSSEVFRCRVVWLSAGLPSKWCEAVSLSAHSSLSEFWLVGVMLTGGGSSSGQGRIGGINWGARREVVVEEGSMAVEVPCLFLPLVGVGG